MKTMSKQNNKRTLLVCVHAGEWLPLTQGRLYEVLTLDDTMGYVRIIDDHGKNSAFMISRFKLA